MPEAIIAEERRNPEMYIPHEFTLIHTGLLFIWPIWVVIAGWALTSAFLPSVVPISYIAGLPVLFIVAMIVPQHIQDASLSWDVVNEPAESFLSIYIDFAAQAVTPIAIWFWRWQVWRRRQAARLTP